jgi:LysR family transcriptional regulator, regulator for bpeEF and oprC
MDKLRALQYFIAAADEQSLSGAARRFQVSVTAVAKLVTALERDLGARLFERTAHGLTLTANGASYLEACQPALAELAEADEIVAASTARLRGTVVVGVQHVLAYHCLLPALPGFHARYPEIRIDVRDFTRVTDEQVRGVDVFLLLGWPEAGDLVHRRIGQARLFVCAAPAYWAAHGVPQRPKDLERHTCLLFRSREGTVMDLWSFKRGEEEESVTVSGWLVTSNMHRDLVVEAALAGEGVVRILKFANRGHVQAGRLVPALADWESTFVPPVTLMYRPSCRRIPRVRLFMDFVAGVFRELERGRDRRIIASGRPTWLDRGYGQASAVGGRGRSGTRG